MTAPELLTPLDALWEWRNRYYADWRTCMRTHDWERAAAVGKGLNVLDYQIYVWRPSAHRSPAKQLACLIEHCRSVFHYGIATITVRMAIARGIAELDRQLAVFVWTVWQR